MKTRTYFIISLLGICALASCSPRIVSNISKQFPAMGPSENVSVLLSSDELPENSIMLGRVKVSSVTLNVERGKDYYIEASIGPGIFLPNPRLFPVSNVAGKVAVSEILNDVTVDNK